MDNDYFRHVDKIDSFALRELMTTYGQDVWNYAYFLTKSYHLADDVSQDVFLIAFRRIGSFRGESSVKTWLFAITRNVAFNYRKSAFMRKVLLFSSIVSKKTAMSAENEFFDRAHSDDLWNHVLQLPKKYREVLVLDARFQMSMRDIAALLGISAGTVKSRLHRARAKVSEMLKEADDYETV